MCLSSYLKEPESHDETEAESVFPNDNRALQLQTRLGAPSIRSSRASLRSRESRNSRLRRMTASQEVNSNFIEIEAPSFSDK